MTKKDLINFLKPFQDEIEIRARGCHDIKVAYEMVEDEGVIVITSKLEES